MVAVLNVMDPRLAGLGGVNYGNRNSNATAFGQTDVGKRIYRHYNEEFRGRKLMEIFVINSDDPDWLRAHGNVFLIS
jgi:hypothetical protein